MVGSIRGAVDHSRIAVVLEQLRSRHPLYDVRLISYNKNFAYFSAPTLREATLFLTLDVIGFGN